MARKESVWCLYITHKSSTEQPSLPPVPHALVSPLPGSSSCARAKPSAHGPAFRLCFQRSNFVTLFDGATSRPQTLPGVLYF